MTLKAFLATAFCLVTVFSTSSASTISLTFSGSAEAECESYYYCPNGVFGVTHGYYEGANESGWGSILQVTGPEGQTAPLSGGSLSFVTAPNYDVLLYVAGHSWLLDEYSGSGGGFEITGSAFGLPYGTLLSGTFVGAACGGSGSYDYINEHCEGSIRPDYINPAMLEGFGLQPNLGFLGSLDGGSGWSMWYANYSSQVAVRITATPEPSAVLLMGWFLLISGLPYLHRLRTRNCCR